MKKPLILSTSPASAVIDATNQAKIDISARATGDLSSSGILGQVTLSINADTTKYDLTVTDAVFVDHTHGAATPLTYLGTVTVTAGTTPYLTSGPVTYLAIDSAGVVATKNVPFTHTERRTKCPVGILRHINLTVIDGVTAQPMMAQDLGMLAHDFMMGLGAYNISGNKLEDNGNSDLTIQRAAGQAFQRVGEHGTTLDDANHINSAVVPNATYFANSRKAGGLANVTLETALDPNRYDSADDTLTTIGNNHVVAHRMTLFPAAGSIILQYGQVDYSNMADAIAGYRTELFDERQAEQLDDGIFMGWYLLTKGITNFGAALLAGTAVCVPSQRFETPARL